MHHPVASTMWLSKYDIRMNSVIGDRHIRTLALILVMIASAHAMAGDIYRWTDANGQVHYGPRPPDDARDARDMLLPEAAAPARDGDQQDAQRRERQRRLLETYAYERERKKAAAAESAQREQQRAQRCHAIQARWRRLAFAGPVYIKRADGTRDFLSDEQRAAEQASLRPAYIEACGEGPG